jgi:hypothetical protein
VSAVDRKVIHVRIRRLILEEVDDASTTDFVATGNPDEIDQAYDEGCERQHAVVLRNAAVTGRLEEHDNPYLSKYIARRLFDIAVDVQDYPYPPTAFKRLWLSVDDIRAVFVPPNQDRLIRTWPSQYGPAKGETLWTVLASGVSSPPDPLDAQRVLRVYVYGNRTVPMQTARGQFTYYRAIQPIAHQSPAAGGPTDVEDPFNDGPIHWGVALLQEKAGQMERSMQNRTLAEVAFDAIMPAPPRPQGQG